MAAIDEVVRMAMMNIDINNNLQCLIFSSSPWK